MATFEAIYIKVNETPDVHFFQNIRSVLQKNGLRFSREGTFRFKENYSWIQIQNLPWIEHLLGKINLDFVPKFAAALSEYYQTEVICLYTQTLVDAVGYWRFENGNEKRCLIHGFYQERVWETVRGNSEEWENDLFLNKEEYSEILSESEDDDLVAEIIEFYQTKQIKIGSSIPFFSSWNVNQIGKYYNLPGFSFSKDWSIEDKV